ncbi:MAG: response regulator [Candidatus Omnitrophota bacterium]|nr:MAG: response regulator [Candidatus Omnitrophota bacterium]
MSVAEPKTILVVDDEEEVVDFLSMALEDAGFHVLTASDGFEALEAIKQQKPDLISLDLVMPKHSGAKLIHDLKKDRELAKIPTLIVTGHARDDLGRADFEELTMSGPGVYLEKPVKPKEYVNAIRKILNLDIRERETEASGKESLKGEVQSLLDDASEEALKEALDVLKKRNG